MAEHAGLPLADYQPQSNANVALVNEIKHREEEILRHLDDLADIETIDKRWLAIGRTNLEQAFMAINRSIFKPTRIEL